MCVFGGLKCMKLVLCTSVLTLIVPSDASFFLREKNSIDFQWTLFPPIKNSAVRGEHMIRIQTGVVLKH